MTTIEDRLGRALGETAEARAVDVERMRFELNDRLTTTRPARRRRVLPAVAAAAVVVVITGTAVGLRTLAGDDGDWAGDAGVGDVATEFTCPVQVPVDLTGAQDEFLPDLSDQSPAAVAEEYAAPRWRFDDEGDSARLLLGNADGTLGSITTYHRADGRWSMVESTACGDGTPGVPTADTLQLGRHGGDPWPAEGMLDPAIGEKQAVFIDDRAVYDYSGLVKRHRTIYAAPCGRRLCWVSGQPDAIVTGRLPANEMHDVTGMFFLPDDMVGRTSPLKVTAYWSPDGDGYRGPMTAFTDPSWGAGVLYVGIEPADG